MAIPDADYIREAEQKGIPPYGSIDEFQEVIVNLVKANIYASKACTFLDTAASEAEKYGNEAQVLDLRDRLEDIRCEIYEIWGKLKQGGE